MSLFTPVSYTYEPDHLLPLTAFAASLNVSEEVCRYVVEICEVSRYGLRGAYRYRCQDFHAAWMKLHTDSGELPSTDQLRLLASAQKTATAAKAKARKSVSNSDQA